MADVGITVLRPATAVLIDDHPIYRSGLRQIVELGNRIEVVAEGSSLAEAERLLGSASPTLMVIDVQLADGSLLPHLRRLRRLATRTHLAVLSMFDDRLTRTVVLEAGIDAYFTKLTEARVLQSAFIALTQQAVSLEHPVAQGRKTGPLSDRELEVLQHVARGDASKHIASDLSLTEATVKRHLYNIYRKLGAQSRTDAIRLARKFYPYI